MKYNNELNRIDTPDKAYLLGYFYADGNVSKNQNHCRLYSVDVQIILELKERFPFFNKYKESNRNTYVLSAGYKSLRQDLINAGCYPDKSKSNKDLLRLPLYNSDITRHFIRGYFDGDGGCSLSYNNRIQKRVYLYSASQQFLIDVKYFISNYNIIATINTQNHKYKNNISTIYCLTISTKSYYKFYQFLYEDVSLYLMRKKMMFSKILKTEFFTQREAPNCKFCDSQDTVYNGNYTYKDVVKPRVLCKDCKRNFTTAPHSSNVMSGGEELLEI